MRSSVDFPQPDGPTSTMNSPSRTVRLDVVDGEEAVPVDLRDAVDLDRGHRQRVAGHTSEPPEGRERSAALVLTTLPDRAYTGRHEPEPSTDERVVSTSCRPRPGTPRRPTSTSAARRELVELMGAEDATVPLAVDAAARVDRSRDRRGRGAARSAAAASIYVGAGTSGRLARVDAVGVRVDVLRRARAGRRARRRRRGAHRDGAGARRGRRRRGRGRDRGARRRPRRRGRRPQRERPDAVRASARSRRRAPSGALTVALVAAPGSELGRACRPRDRRRRRARGDRRLDAPQGGHRAEARPQQDLDDRDGPARQDVRRT